MNSRYLTAMIVFAEVCSAAKAPKKLARIQVVASDESVREIPHYVPGRAGTSTTNCNESATATGMGNVVTGSGNSNCNTVTTAATPAHTENIDIQQTHVRVIMDDGRHVVLWCQKAFRKCESPAPGEYDIEIDGDTVWLHDRDLSGKDFKVKYHHAGNW